MENGPFIDDFPMNTSIYEGFSMAMLDNQMVYLQMVVSLINMSTPTPLLFPLITTNNLDDNLGYPMVQESFKCYGSSLPSGRQTPA
jgi:hypothetical protein